MRLPVLRETRMTAVVCSLGPVQRVVDAAPIISDAVLDALSAWVAAPVAPRSTQRSDQGKRRLSTGLPTRCV